MPLAGCFHWMARIVRELCDDRLCRKIFALRVASLVAFRTKGDQVFFGVFSVRSKS
jgi:hypothetical protein